jgi:alanine-synthesizing transaminase
VLSRRTGRSRTPNRVSALIAEARANFVELLDLTGSNPTRAGLDYPAEILQVLLRAQQDSLSYRPEPLGALSARKAVIKHLIATRGPAAEVDPDDVLLTASTSEAYAHLFKLLCDPDDQLLIPTPSYPLLDHLAELEGVAIAPYRLAYDGAWHIDLDSLRRGVTARTRGIVLVSPNNPSGQYQTEQEMAALAGLGLPIISDQVFFEYPLEVSAPSDVTLGSEGLTFALGGLSKLLGLPQLKLAWTVLRGSRRAVQEARERLELIADTFLSVATAAQVALPELLQLAPHMNAVIAGRCRQNLATLRRAVEATPLGVLRAEGGWNAVLQFPRLIGEEDLMTTLITRHRVLVQPGWFYDFENEPYAIVSLLTSPDVFGQGIGRLVDCAAQLS